MNKKSIIILSIFALLSTIFVLFFHNFYSFTRNKLNYMVSANEYLYGTATGAKGKIGLKVKLDNSGTIKEVIVTEHSNSEIAIPCY